MKSIIYIKQLKISNKNTNYNLMTELMIILKHHLILKTLLIMKFSILFQITKMIIKKRLIQKLRIIIKWLTLKNLSKIINFQSKMSFLLIKKTRMEMWIKKWINIYSKINLFLKLLILNKIIILVTKMHFKMD